MRGAQHGNDKQAERSSGSKLRKGPEYRCSNEPGPSNRRDQDRQRGRSQVYRQDLHVSSSQGSRDCSDAMSNGRQARKRPNESSSSRESRQLNESDHQSEERHRGQPRRHQSSSQSTPSRHFGETTERIENGERTSEVNEEENRCVSLFNLRNAKLTEEEIGRALKKFNFMRIVENSEQKDFVKKVVGAARTTEKNVEFWMFNYFIEKPDAEDGFGLVTQNFSKLLLWTPSLGSWSFQADLARLAEGLDKEHLRLFETKMGCKVGRIQKEARSGLGPELENPIDVDFEVPEHDEQVHRSQRNLRQEEVEVEEGSHHEHHPQESEEPRSPSRDSRNDKAPESHRREHRAQDPGSKETQIDSSRQNPKLKIHQDQRHLDSSKISLYDISDLSTDEIHDAKSKFLKFRHYKRSKVGLNQMLLFFGEKPMEFKKYCLGFFTQKSKAHGFHRMKENVAKFTFYHRRQKAWSFNHLNDKLLNEFSKDEEKEFREQWKMRLNSKEMDKIVLSPDDEEAWREAEETLESGSPRKEARFKVPEQKRIVISLERGTPVPEKQRSEVHNRKSENLDKGLTSQSSPRESEVQKKRTHEDQPTGDEAPRSTKVTKREMSTISLGAKSPSQGRTNGVQRQDPALEDRSKNKTPMAQDHYREGPSNEDQPSEEAQNGCNPQNPFDTVVSLYEISTKGLSREEMLAARSKFLTFTHYRNYRKFLCNMCRFFEETPTDFKKYCLTFFDKTFVAEGDLRVRQGFIKRTFYDRQSKTWTCELCYDDLLKELKEDEESGFIYRWKDSNPDDDISDNDKMTPDIRKAWKKAEDFMRESPSPNRGRSQKREVTVECHWSEDREVAPELDLGEEDPQKHLIHDQGDLQKPAPARRKRPRKASEDRDGVAPEVKGNEDPKSQGSQEDQNDNHQDPKFLGSRPNQSDENPQDQGSMDHEDPVPGSNRNTDDVEDLSSTKRAPESSRRGRRARRASRVRNPDDNDLQETPELPGRGRRGRRRGGKSRPAGETNVSEAQRSEVNTLREESARARLGGRGRGRGRGGKTADRSRQEDSEVQNHEFVNPMDVEDDIDDIEALVYIESPRR